MDETYEDPRFASDQGRYVSTGGDAGGYWEPLSVATPLGRYVGSGDSGGYWEEYTPEQRAAEAARIEADRLGRLDYASSILKQSPLSVMGDQIQTRYGDRPVSRFNPIAEEGKPITAETPAQLVSESGSPVFLRDKNDPTSYTYDNTGIPAISGTVGQQAALYRPIENKGVFGTLGGDLLSAAKDPYFHKFLAATAAIGGTGLALNSAYGVGGLGAAPVAESLPVALGDGIVTTGGGLAPGSSTAGGFLGGAGEILPGAVGTGGGSLGGSTFLSGLDSLVGGITPAKAFQAARLAMPIVGALTGAGSSGGSGSSSTPVAFQMTSSQGGYGSGSGLPSAPTTFMSSYESPAEVEARNLKFGAQASKFPELNNVTPELRNMLYAKLQGENNPFANDPLGALDRGEIMTMRDGGDVVNEQGEPHIPEFVTGKTGHYVQGRGTGQSDDIPAMLAKSEYVFDADTVSALGDGSSEAGAELLDKFREAIREHKRSAPSDKIPPKASPLQYMKVAMKSAGRVK